MGKKSGNAKRGKNQETHTYGCPTEAREEPSVVEESNGSYYQSSPTASRTVVIIVAVARGSQDSTREFRQESEANRGDSMSVWVGVICMCVRVMVVCECFLLSVISRW